MPSIFSNSHVNWEVLTAGMLRSWRQGKKVVQTLKLCIDPWDLLVRSHPILPLQHLAHVFDLSSEKHLDVYITIQIACLQV